MSVYKPKRSPFYAYDFEIDGRRFFGSTKETSKREAERAELTAREAAAQTVAAEKIAAAAPLNLDRACGRYWLEVGRHHSGAETSWTNIERLLRFFGKDKPLAAITDDEVAKLVAWRRGHHVKDDPARPLVSNTTVNRSALDPLKRIINRARNVWKAKLPDAPDWKQHYLPEPEPESREIPAADRQAIDDELRRDYEPFFAFATASGRRLASCIIRWSDVDWERGVIETRGKGKRIVRTPITKTIRAILLPLKSHHPEFVFTYVVQRTREAPPVRLKRLLRDGKPAPAARAGERAPITYNGVKSYWRRMKRRIGVKRRFHDLRHDLACKILRETGNLRTVQKALGHARPETTFRYAQVLDEDVRGGIEAAAESLKKSRKRTGGRKPAKVSAA